MITTISSATDENTTRTVKHHGIELGPGKNTADAGGFNFQQAGVAEYSEKDNGGASPAYDFVPSGEYLAFGDPQVDYRIA